MNTSKFVPWANRNANTSIVPPSLRVLVGVEQEGKEQEDHVEISLSPTFEKPLPPKNNSGLSPSVTTLLSHLPSVIPKFHATSVTQSKTRKPPSPSVTTSRLKMPSSPSPAAPLIDILESPSSSEDLYLPEVSKNSKTSPSCTTELHKEDIVHSQNNDAVTHPCEASLETSKQQKNVSLTTRLEELERYTSNDGQAQKGKIIARIKSIEKFVFESDYKPPKSMATRVDYIAERIGISF